MALETRPFLRWAGSKRLLLPKLIPCWDGNGAARYVEPFMGSACLFFAIRPRAALLSDMNSELVRTFLTVRDHPAGLSRAIDALPRGKLAYYRLRKQDPCTLGAMERAARFIYLNRFCFNGLYRTNRAGQFNVPYSESRNGQLPTDHELATAAAALTCAEIRCADFEDALESVRSNDFVYLDPPYAVSSRRIFRQYGPATFGTDDLKRLRRGLLRLDRRGIPFVVTYAMCAEALRTFAGWSITRTRTSRNISGFAQHRRKAVELIITNQD